VLVALYDSRWGTNMTKALIAMAEIDMNENIGLLYCMPDMILEIRDFCKYIKVGIQLKGYEGWSHGNNLIVCLRFVEKCINNSQINYKVEFNDVVKMLSSKHIKMIKPMTYNSEELAGLE
jgi:hypothetical protein